MTSQQPTTGRRCRFCDRSFTPTHALERFCDEGCRWAGRRRGTRAALTASRGQIGEVDLRLRWIPTGEPRYEPAYIDALTYDPCAYCGDPTDVIDHITAASKGGDNTTANLTGCCAYCNLSKAALPMLHYLLVRRLTREARPLIEQIAAITGDEPDDPRARPHARRIRRQIRRTR